MMDFIISSASNDISAASVAGVYDAALGGDDNYEVDREVVRRLRQVAPEIGQVTNDHRDFAIRLTRFIAGKTGIRQFLDCGSRLSAEENTHQVARRIGPGARVVYVHSDPVVAAHGRALLKEDSQTHFISADIFAPHAFLNEEDIRNYLDFSEPIALFHLGTLHHYHGEPSPADIMAEYIDFLPSGSYVALSHFLDPENEDSELAHRLEQAFVHSPLRSGWFRTRSEILSMFPGLDLVEPGLTLCVDWRPDGPRTQALTPPRRCLVGAVGHKP